MSLDQMITDLEGRASVQGREVRALLDKSEKGELSRREKAHLEVEMRGMDAYADRIADLKAERDRKARIAEAIKAAGIGAVGTEARGRGDLANVSVTGEPTTYGIGSPNSYYKDLIYSSQPGHPVSFEARDRLTQWGHEVTVEVNLRSELGRAASRALSNLTRENRTGIATGGGATATAASGGAAFVSPAIVIPDYAAYRMFGRAVADRCSNQELPDYGMEIYLPAVQGPAGVSSQAERRRDRSDIRIFVERAHDVGRPGHRFATDVGQGRTRHRVRPADLRSVEPQLCAAGGQVSAHRSFGERSDDHLERLVCDHHGQRLRWSV